MFVRNGQTIIGGGFGRGIDWSGMIISGELVLSLKRRFWHVHFMHIVIISEAIGLM